MSRVLSTAQGLAEIVPERRPSICGPALELTPERRRQLLFAHATTARQEAVEFELQSLVAERNHDRVSARVFWRECLRARVVARDIEDRLAATR